MPVPYRRATVAGVLAAAAVAVPIAALATGSGSPGAKPAPSSTAVKAKSAEAGSADPRLTGPSSVATLAARLGVSTSAARRALQHVGALSAEDGVDPASAAFAAIARELGVTPSRLAGALAAVKQSMAGR